MKSVSLIITNYNGYRLLKRNLISVINASSVANEIIVTDDASTDKSLSYLKSVAKSYPKLKIVAHRHNLGFGKNSNSAAKIAKGDFIVFLNNDIRPVPGYISAALKLFSNPTVAAVGFSEIGNENWARIFWSGGYLQHSPGPASSSPHITAWVSGGGSIFRKDIFTKLGGFDPAYSPFYYEDADLGLRLWQSGYRLLWCPTARIEHHHESTMSRFPPHFLNYVKERNRLLLTWRRISDKSLLSHNHHALLGRVLTGPNYLKIIRAAKNQMARFPSPANFSTISDTALLNLFK
jgi:GT2 family glycosyltransferase